MTEITIASILALLAPDAEAKDTTIVRQFFLIPSLETARLAESVFLAADIDAKAHPEPSGAARFFVTLPPEEKRAALLVRAEAYALLASRVNGFVTGTLRSLVPETSPPPSVRLKALPNGVVNIGIDVALLSEQGASQKEPPPLPFSPAQTVSGEKQQNPAEEEIALERGTMVAKSRHLRALKHNKKDVDDTVAKVATVAAHHLYEVRIILLTIFIIVLAFVLFCAVTCPGHAHYDQAQPWYCSD